MTHSAIWRDILPTSVGSVHRSIRLRLGAWAMVVIIATLTVFTGLDLLHERREVLRIERAHAYALLDHLSGMPQMRSDVRSARQYLAAVGAFFEPVGARLELIPGYEAMSKREGPRTPLPGIDVIAERELLLNDGVHFLRYRVARSRVLELAARAVVVHSLHALVALLMLVAGMELIFRRRLLMPVSKMSQQVTRMGSGFGFDPQLPPVDQELEALQAAITGLRPELEKRLDEQLSAEERSLIALTLVRIEHAVRERLRDAFIHLTDLQARDQVLGAGKENLRAVICDLEAISETIRSSGDTAWLNSLKREKRS